MPYAIPKTPPKAIIFDWDNTLADTWPLIHEALTETLVAMGHEPWSFEKMKRDVHRSMRDSFPELFGDRWEEAAAIYQKSYRTNRVSKLVALAHAEQVLDSLKNKPDIYVAIVSNKMGTPLREEVKQLGWDHYFSKIIGAQDAPADKPSRAPVEMALAGSGIELGPHVWFIGDSLTDMETAANTGTTAIFYGDDNPQSEKYAHCRPHFHVLHHQELIDLLQKVTA